VQKDLHGTGGLRRKRKLPRRCEYQHQELPAIAAVWRDADTHSDGRSTRQGRMRRTQGRVDEPPNQPIIP
jgi:hypothetical protein